jgi:hypothetical protein
MVEREPNNTMAAAQALPRVPEIDVIVDGDVSSPGDRDWFRLDLRAGDVLGAALAGQSGLNPAMRLVDSAAQLLVSNDNAFFTGGQLLPPESPLPRDQSHGQNAELYYVVSAAGTYFIEVAASADASAGKYKLDLVVARPGLEKEPVGTRQILFLDFDGATVNFTQFAGDEVTGTKRLAPLSSFLTDWGLSPADENAVIDGVMAKVTAKLSAYVRGNGLNGDFALTGIPGQFDIEIRNSRDHPDEFGKNRFVSRVVVGGTEAQVGHAGLAQDVDVGNFKTDDEAVATLDRLTRGLARIPIRPPATTIDFLTEGIATLVAHEAGHLFGSFHTDQSPTDIFAGTGNLMDPNYTAHVGPDNIFGTGDDADMQLGVDGYLSSEVFRGVNDTLNTVSFGLSTGRRTEPGPAPMSPAAARPAAVPGTGSAAFAAASVGESGVGTPAGFGPVTQDPADRSPDWPSSGHDQSNTGYNAAERAISAGTVAGLTVSRQHGPASVVGTPIISEGVVYLADSFGVVYAKNAVTGTPIWANDVSDALDPIFGASFQAAPVVTRDAVFLAGSDAFVYRLDRRTGALEWKTRVDDNPNALTQSDPLVFEGQVLVGVASHENEEPGADPTDNFMLRGSVVGLDAETGAVVWQTFTTSDQALAHPKFGAGVGVWSSPAVDPRTGRLFVGTGNYYEPGSDDPSPPSRRDTDLSDSLLSLGTKNGKVKDSR